MKKKKPRTTSNLREGFYEARVLEDHEYFFGNSQMNESMNENFIQVEVFSYTANRGHRLSTYIMSFPILKKIIQN